MVEIQVEGDHVVFEVQGWDKMWGLVSRLTIPTAHIAGARRDPDLKMSWFDGLKLAGTGIPDFFRAGIFFQKNDLVYWDVRHLEQAIVVDLDHERYKRLIIEVADPDGAVAMLNQVAGARRG